MRILVVEDEPKVARALEHGFKSESYSVAVAHTGNEGFFKASSEPFDLMVLDVMLPDRSGLEVLSTMRHRGMGMPVFCLLRRMLLKTAF